jgi:predicted GNAT family acetyltransferase
MGMMGNIGSKLRNAGKVLFKDANENDIVWANDSTRLSVNNPDTPRNITLWKKQDVNGKEYWRKAGALNVNEKFKTFDGETGKYLNVSEIEIEKAFRGQGLGNKMYETLIDLADTDAKGIISYTPNRVNKVQVPKIYEKFGAVTKDDYQIIPLNQTGINNAAGKYLPSIAGLGLGTASLYSPEAAQAQQYRGMAAKQSLQEPTFDPISLFTPGGMLGNIGGETASAIYKYLTENAGGAR